MIWALEAIPLLNDMCGERQKDEIPRVCRWYCRKKPSGLVKFFERDLQVLTTFTALEDEMKQDYYISFDSDQFVGPILHKTLNFGNDSADDVAIKDDNVEEDAAAEDAAAEDDVHPVDNVGNEDGDIESEEEREHRESKSKMQHEQFREPVMVVDHPPPPTSKSKNRKKERAS
ncbi:hypothetical protein ACOSQ4_016766 [Xanthoceras sorbifolium]